MLFLNPQVIAIIANWHCDMQMCHSDVDTSRKSVGSLRKRPISWFLVKYHSEMNVFCSMKTEMFTVAES